MKTGVCLPYMKAGVTRDDYLAWFQRIDEGPFHSLSCGERVNGPSYDMGSLLAAAAVATNRVEINATLYVLPMHSAVQVAKEIATVDVLSGEFKVFDSLHQEITVEATLATAAIPTLFQTAEMGAHADWDGLFSENPPIRCFLSSLWKADPL